MKSELETVESHAEKSPYNKVIGIVTDREQLRAVSAALTACGAKQIDVLDGAAGMVSLDAEQDAVSQCFMGDMEAGIVERYRQAVQAGKIVFAATVEPDVIDQAAEQVKSLGATEVVHFGNWVITNY